MINTQSQTQEKLNKIQLTFILKAVDNFDSIYDFTNTTKEEFIDCYGIKKEELIKNINELKKWVLHYEKNKF